MVKLYANADVVSVLQMSCTLNIAVGKYNLQYQSDVVVTILCLV